MIIAHSVVRATMEEIWEIVREGNRFVQFDDQKEAILVLGLPGSGKTTTTLLLNKDNDNLVAKEIKGQMIIETNATHVNFPRPMKDGETIYYDCPSFGDLGDDPTREITSTYFMRKLIDRLERFKFLFTIDYSFLKRVDQRESFVNWIRKVRKIVKNIEEFEGSIGLVVTKVDNLDSEIIREIKHTLESLRLFIQRDEYDWIFKNYASKLIDIFLSNKLVVVRRPKELGLVREMKDLQEDVARVREMMRNGTEFASGSENFAYGISTMSKNHVSLMVREVDANMVFIIGQLAEKLRKHLDNKEKQSFDIYEVRDYIDLAYEQVVLILDTMNTTDNFKDIGNRLEESLEILNVWTAGNELSRFFLQLEHLGFLREFSSERFDIKYWGFKSKWEGIKSYLNVVKNWYLAILTLNSEMLKYYVLVDSRFKFDLSQLESEIRSISNGEQLKELMKKLFGKCEYYSRGLTFLDEIPKFEKNIVSRLEELIKLLGNLLREDKPKDNRESGELTITGGFVRADRINWSQNYNSVKIFVRKKFFVNTDFNLNQWNFNVAMFTPAWDVLFSKRIVSGNGNCNHRFLGVGQEFITRTESSVNLNGCLEHNVIELNNPGPITCRPSKYEAKSITEYKGYLMKYLPNRIDYRETNEMLQSLSNNTCIQNYYATETIIDDFLQLETAFEWKRKKEFIPLYESLVKTIQIYAEKTTGAEERRILKSVYLAAWSKYWSLKKDTRGNLIIRIKDKLDDFLSLIEDVRNENKIRLMKGYAGGYKKKIQDEIDGMKNIISKHVMPELDELEKEAKKKMEDFIKEAREMKEDMKTNAEVMKEQRKQMSDMFLGNIGLSIFKKLGRMAGGLSSLAIDIMEPNMPKKITPAQAGEIPDSIFWYLEEAKSDNEMVKSVDEVIEKIPPNSNIPDFSKTDMKKVIKDTRDIFDRMKKLGSKLKGFEFKNLKQKFKDCVKNIKNKLSEAVKGLKSGGGGGGGGGKSGPGKIGGGIILTAQVISAGVGLVKDVFDEAKNEQAKMDQLDKSIKQEEKNIERMGNFSSKLESRLGPHMDELNDMQEKVESMNTESRGKFMKEKWDISEAIKDIQVEMRGVSSSFQVGPHLTSVYNRMKGVLDQVMDIYKQIHDSREKGELVGLIENMNEASAGGGEKWLEDQGLSKKLQDIQERIRYNVMIGQYNRLYEAIKLAVFPFVQYYLEDGKEDFSGGTGRQVWADDMKNKIVSLRRKIVDHQGSVMTGMDYYIKDTTFASWTQYNNPFYVWKNQDFHRDVEKLLQGEEIVLVADVVKGRTENAVKFNRIEFTLKAPNKRMQETIDEILLDFEVSLIHSGISRYKCGAKYYAIVSGGNKLEYTYARYDFGDKEPLDMSNAYKKIKNVIPILSPYTTWTVRLVKKHDRNDTRFEELAEYVDHVDLELGGKGSYVREDAEVCNWSLDKFYNVDLNLSEGPRVYSSAQKSRARREIREETRQEFDEFQGFGNYSCPVNGTLMLLDLVARKLTGSKVKEIEERGSVSSVEDVFVRAANMTRKFESSVKKLIRKWFTSGVEFVFDPCVLIDRLKSGIGGRNSGGIMYDFVVENNPALTRNEFLDELRKIVSVY